jgi:Sugar (and other) transporter
MIDQHRRARNHSFTTPGLTASVFHHLSSTPVSPPVVQHDKVHHHAVPPLPNLHHLSRLDAIRLPPGCPPPQPLPTLTQAELNTPGSVLTCPTTKKALIDLPKWLPGCILKNDSEYGFVTSVYSLGGLAGSFFAARLAERFGRRGAALGNCIGFVLGPIIMSLSTNFGTLALGRTVSGLSSGVAMVLVPLYLNEIAPKTLRGAFGVICQVFVVIGIALAQLLSLFWSTIPYWRGILLFGGMVGAGQFVLLLFACESPKWIALQYGGQGHAQVILRKIRGENSDDEVREWRRRCSLPTETDGTCATGLSNCRRGAIVTADEFPARDVAPRNIGSTA